MNDENDKPKDDDWGMTMPHLRYEEKKKAGEFSDDFAAPPNRLPASADDEWGMTTPNLNVRDDYSSYGSSADDGFDKTTPNLDVPKKYSWEVEPPAPKPLADEWGMTEPNLNVPQNNYSSSSSDADGFAQSALNPNAPKKYSWETDTPTAPLTPPPADDWGMTQPNVNFTPENKSSNQADEWGMTTPNINLPATKDQTDDWKTSAPDFHPPPLPEPPKNQWAMPTPVFRVSEGENIEDIKRTAAFKLSDLQDFDMNTMDFKPSEPNAAPSASFDKPAPAFNFHENQPPTNPPVVPNNFHENQPLPPSVAEPINSPAVETGQPPPKKKRSKVPFIVGGFAAMFLFGSVLIGAVYFLFLKKPSEIVSTAAPAEPETASNTSAPLAVAPPVTTTASDLPKQIEYKGAMMLVPAGEFMMGSDTGADDAKPAHKVDLPAYYIDRTEVTNAEYKAFCDATGKSYPPSPHFEKDYFTNRPNAPVVGVSFADARGYAEWAGKRLPTEEEWEKAASWDAATKTKHEFPWGNDFKKSDAAFQTGKISDVGKYAAGASPSGALDMAGNVLEWVDAYFQPYSNSTVSNPEFGETNRVVRGGHFASKSSDSLKTTKRIYIPPTVASGEDDEKLVAAIIGFRCAVSADAPRVADVIRANGK